MIIEPKASCANHLQIHVLFIVLAIYCLSKDELHYKNGSFQNIKNAIRNTGNGKNCAPGLRTRLNET